MGQKIATLEIEMMMVLGQSISDLVRFGGVVDKTSAEAIRALDRIDNAVNTMANLDPLAASAMQATQEIEKASASVRELNRIKREAERTEASGEGMVARLTRENAAYGLTRAEVKALRIEEAALAVERTNPANTDLPRRLREQAAMMEASARAAREATAADAAFNRNAAAGPALFEAHARSIRQRNEEMERAAAAERKLAEASAANKLAADHDRLAAAVRGSHDAQMADAAAAERLRASTDPLYAVTKRLNAEIAESNRLYHAGVTPSGEYARQQQVLADRLRDVTKQHEAHSGALGRAGSAARLSRTDMLNLGYQLNDVAVSLISGQKPFTVFAQQGAQIGQIAATSGVGLRGMAASVGALIAPFAPLAIALTIAAGGLALFARDVEKGVDTKAMVAGLGLTRQEIKRLKDTSVDTGDVMMATFQVLAQRVGIDMTAMTGWFDDALDFMTKIGRNALAALYAQFAGTFGAIGTIVRDVLSGKGIGDIIADVGKGYQTAFDDANGAMKRFGADVTQQVASNKLKDLTKQANEMKLDRTPKTDRLAERLEREDRAIEAQIKNLYRLADAYDVSDVAALQAEARLKAESDAVKKRGDIDLFYARQLRLMVAERVRDTAKAAGDLNAQAAAQELVNQKVAAGLIPAGMASDALRDEIARRPILAAIQIAQGDERERAINQLLRLEAAQDRANAASRRSPEVTALAGGRDQLALIEEETRLIGASNKERVHALALMKAQQEAANRGFGPEWVAQQVKIADAQEGLKDAQDSYNESLTITGDLFGLIDRNAQQAAQGISDAFGETGRAVGDALTSVTGYYAQQARLREAHEEAITKAGTDQQRIDRENARFALANSGAQVRLYGNMASAAKGFFKEGTTGYKAMGAAEKVFRAIELANAIKSAAIQLGLIGGVTAAKVAGDATMAASDTSRSLVEIANSAASGLAKGAEAVVNAIRSLPFPANIAAGAATAAVVASLGFAIGGALGGGGKNNLPKANEGTGTVLGDSDAKSESIQRSLDALRDIDDATLTVSRGMLSSLRTIEQSIGGLSTLLVRAGNIDASSGVDQGFKTNAVGSLLSNIPVLGGLLGGLFGTKTKVVASGLYGGAQSLDDILSGGFDASYYSDVQKKKKLFGLTTSTKYRTEYAGADAGIEDQFTLLLRQFYETIGQAAEPLGVSLDAVKSRLTGFTVDIGKIDLQGLTGDEIQEKLSAVFGAAADDMAEAALPGLARFQKVGEGAFETLVRVSSTVEQMDAAFQRLGVTGGTLGLDTSMAIAGLFDSVADFTSAADGYLDAFYSDAERAAAETARMGKAFGALGVTMPETLAGFRALVDAQDLTSAAGQQMYATLLQLAPAFAELKGAMDGAASAAAIVREREDLQRKLLELSGDEAAIRAADLAKIDPSNRALQKQVYAIQDAQEAAKAAEQLRDAWGSVGDSIMAEVKRIRGLNDAGGGKSFASLMGQFNAATAAATAGDMDAAKSLPQLSKSLLDAAALAATSRQELDRVQGQTASVLEAVAAAIGGTTATADPVEAAATATAAQTTATANSTAELVIEVRALRAEVANLRQENNAGHAATAGNTGRLDRRVESITAASGGTAVSVTGEAA